MKYNFNASAYNRYMRDCKKKKQILQQIIEKATLKLDRLDMENLAKDPWRTFQMGIIDKYAGDNFEFIGFDKLCDLLSYDPEPVRQLCIKYGSIKVVLNPLTLEPTKSKDDFYHVAEGKEQKERLKYAQSLVNVWVDHSKNFPDANPFKYVQAFNGILLPDYSDLKNILVNPNYVTGKPLVQF